MNAEKWLWPALSFLVGLLSVLLPIYVSYDLFERGQTPEKRVELTRQQPIDPLRDLSALGDKVTLSLRLENQSIDNVTIVKTWLQNVGHTPILPTD
jgi:hypothetical protein